MQRQDVDAGTKAQAPGALGDGREEDILRGGQAMGGRRVVFGQVIRVEAGCVEPLYLQQPLAVDAVQAQPRHRLRSEEHTSELQSRGHLVCRLLLEKKKKTT